MLAPETQALLALILPPAGKTSTARTDAVYAAVASLHDLSRSVDVAVADIDRARRAAEAVEEDPTATAFFERIKQTAQALRRLSGDAGHALDRLSDTSWQLDCYAGSMQQALALKGDPETAVVAISVAEHQHLLERVAAADAIVREAARGQASAG